jgi:hypothetical protein
MWLDKLPKFLFQVLGCILLLALSCTTLGAGNKEDEDMRKKITAIIDYGALAPSSHNAQMWKVKLIGSNKIRVLVDQQHILPQVDPENRETIISLGAFIENMVEAAPGYDLQAEVRIITGSPDDQEIAELTFDTQAGPASATDVLSNIQNRHTIRTPYLRKELLAQDAAWFKTFGTELHYFALTSQEGQYIKNAIIEATSRQVASDDKQRELAGLFRFSKKEAEKEKDGLTPDGMGLSGIAKWFVSTFFTRDTVMSKSFRKQTVATAKKQAENCSGFVLLTAGDNSVASLINSGRSLEKFLIMATGKKLAVHPMSAPLEESPWKEEFSQKIGIAKTVQMILRVGYVKDYGHPVSKRRKVSITQ